MAKCPECGDDVLAMELQGMRLNWPAVKRAEHPAAMFGLMNLGGQWVAGAGGEMTSDFGHELHEHQPPERE